MFSVCSSVQRLFLKLYHLTVTVLGREQPSCEQSQSPCLWGHWPGKCCGTGKGEGMWEEMRRGKTGEPSLRKGEHESGSLGKVSRLRRACKESGPEMGTCVECPRTARTPRLLARIGLGDMLKGRAGIQIDGALNAILRPLWINSECNGKSTDHIKYLFVCFSKQSSFV